MADEPTRGRGGLYLGRGRRLHAQRRSATSPRPPDGYLWDYARSARTSPSAATASSCRTRRRSRPAATSSPSKRARPRGPGGARRTPAATSTSRDQKRVDIWLAEFRGFAAERQPAAAVDHPPPQRSHASGTKPGAPTPRAMVADNDLALGRIVETICRAASTGRTPRSSSSKTMRRAGPTTWTRIGRCCSWRARSRSAGSSITRSTRRRACCGRSSSFSGCRPMSQYDAAATPLYQRVPGHAEPRGVHAPADARVPLDEKNLPTAFGATLSRGDGFLATRTGRPKRCSTRSSGDR